MSEQLSKPPEQPERPELASEQESKPAEQVERQPAASERSSKPPGHEGVNGAAGCTEGFGGRYSFRWCIAGVTAEWEEDEPEQFSECEEAFHEAWLAASLHYTSPSFVNRTLLLEILRDSIAHHTNPKPSLSL